MIGTRLRAQHLRRGGVAVPMQFGSVRAILAELCGSLRNVYFADLARNERNATIIAIAIFQ